MRVSYTGPLFDYSGYGEANRHAVAALHAAGCDVYARSVSYTMISADMGSMGSLMRDLCGKVGTAPINIIHTTPDQYKKYLVEGAYNIGHFFWETDKVPEVYVEGLNLMNEIWTGSVANKDAIRRGGYEGKVFVCPQAIETERNPVDRPYKLLEHSGFTFYSIFEWIDRKNPQQLLKAYWEAFQDDEDVALVIKAYFRDFSRENKKMIRNKVQMLKEWSGLTKFPKTYLYLDLMDRDHINRLHHSFDCYVSPHRGEGWGVPIVEAMLAGRPVIATGYGGIGEYLPEDGAIKLDFEMAPVFGMDHTTLYSRDQNWADPSHNQLVDAFREMYRNQEKAKAMGITCKTFVENNLNLKKVGDIMKNRLELIEKEL